MNKYKMHRVQSKKMRKTNDYEHLLNMRLYRRNKPKLIKKESEKLFKFQNSFFYLQL
jgi:hypothetical protein